MRVRLCVALTLAVAVLVALGPTGTSAAPSTTTAQNAVVHWSGIAASAIVAGPRPPASSSVLGGMVHGAMYDAAAAVEGGLEPFATGITAARGASADAAVAQAARDVLVARVPGQAGFVQTEYDTYMATIPEGPAKDAGKAAGAAAAAGMLAMRSGDHFDDVVAYVQPTPGPGVFEPIAATPVVDTKLPFVRPFTLGPLAEYRPGEPAELTSKRYAEDVAEVHEYGRATGSLRTPEQTAAARFWTEQTYFQYSRALRELVVARGLDLRESARLLGYVNVALADTMIACWEAKFHYMFWRPNHAIQRADTDANPATSKEDGWLPLVTGNHPEYPSGHACATAAVTESLRSYFGTEKVEFTVSTTAVGGGPPRTFERLDELVEDVENARVWGGLHFRTTMERSGKHYSGIAREIGKHYFLVKDKD